MTHAFCFFCSVGRRVRQGTSIALAPKKTIALQARRGSPPDVAPISGKSGAGVTASSAGLVPPTVVPVPSVGQTVIGAEGTPSEVTEKPTTEVIPLPTSERTEPPLTLVGPTTVGVTSPVEAPPTQMEAAATVMS